eukprot:CAMPEP_0197525842 /NCGR_PEP_ID=MMETSP1318-20131121/14932_1 /TAXON_ID=552666 /ORGANISM="Partenskyella glossopodia, Strain RCC365" /LENGTH=36 /DNA_ID= /DNA_START= /DNA_END= /DNA_ORIENTATION=
MASDLGFILRAARKYQQYITLWTNALTTANKSPGDA